MPQLNIKIPKSLMEEIKDRKEQTGQSKAGIVKNAIAESLDV